MTEPHVRRINMLSEYHNPDGEHGTRGFFRALSEADDLIHQLDHAAELVCRCDELNQLVDDIKALHNRVITESPDDRWACCADCGSDWPCPTIKLIEGKP